MKYFKNLFLALLGITPKQPEPTDNGVYIVVEKARNGQKFLTIKGKNHQKLAHSETYKDPRNVENNIRLLRGINSNTKIVRKD